MNSIQNMNIDKKVNFFSRSKNIFEWFGIGCTILGLFIAVLFSFKGNSIEGSEDLLRVFKWVYIGFIILYIGILSLAVIFAYRSGKLQDEKNQTLRLEQNLQKNIDELELQIRDSQVRQDQIMSMIHNIFHESRDILCTMIDTNLLINSDLIKFYEEKSLNTAELDLIEADLDSDFNEYCNNVVNNIKNLFDILTKDECCVTIKLFDSISDRNTENVKIDDVVAVTFKRDSVSRRSRRHIDSSMPSYNIKSNTAFREIVQSDNRSYYYCNNLMENKDYDNSNSNWRKYYNACLVSGIVADNDAKSYTVLGALCVDNFKGNFDDKITHNILASIADIFASVLYEYSGIQEVIEALQETKTN